MKFDAPEPRLPAGKTEGQEHADRDGDENVCSRRLKLCTRAWRSVGSCQTESTGSPQYQRVENESQTVRERVALKENCTAMRTGTIDQRMYAQVKTTRKRGFHGVAQPAAHSYGRRPSPRPGLRDRGHSAPTAPASRCARWMLHM